MRADKGFINNDEALASFLKALAHPVRIGIVRSLMERCECMKNGTQCKCGDSCIGKNCKCGCKCGTLVELFDMSQSTVSQHIKELKKEGLIELSGRKGDYTLNHSRLKEGLNLLLDLLKYKTPSIMEENKCQCQNGGKCTCGDNCTCGPDCECRNGGTCTCGDNCNCNC